MYTRFFGLKHEPFSLAPDPRYLYMSKRHREALAHLLYGVGAGGGFVLLSGEIGAGKTTVCRCFLEQIPKRCNVAYIFNPKLTPVELMTTICDEFHIAVRTEPGTPPTLKTYVDALNEFLLKTHAVGQNNVLIIDEAQMLSVEVLEQLRLLTNLETTEKKLLQIVLIGQPELRTMLERPDLEQLAQRVIARFHLKALSQKETEHYIRHRLSVAGMSRAIPFDRQALLRIYQIARGVPRRINLLCDRAMLGAYAHGRQQVDAAIVEKAAREVFGSSEAVTPDRSGIGRGVGVALIAAAAAALGALLAVAGYSAYRNAQDKDGPATTVHAASEPSKGGSSAASAPGASGPTGQARIDSTSASAAIAAALAAERAFAATVARGSTAAASGGAGSTAASAVAAASVARPASTVSRAPMGASASASMAATPTATPPATLVAASASPATPPAASASAPLQAAASIASAAAPAASGTVTALADLKSELRTVAHDEASAWRALAALWHVDASRGDPCAAALRQQVRCYKFAAGLPLVRSLDRPGFFTVKDDAGKSVAVVLVGLGSERALVLGDDGARRSVPVASLAKAWPGEFGTLWRMPPGYASALAEGASGPLVDRLATQLAAIEGASAPAGSQTFDAGLRTRVVRFQSSHGLSAAGKAGPTTFMQLNRATGVDEPKLLAAAAR